MYVLIFFVFLSNLLNMLAGYHIAKVLTHEIRGQPILANLLKKVWQYRLTTVPANGQDLKQV